MANPNPYKKYDLPDWVLDAFNRRDFESIKKHMQFLLHRSRKFEKCYQREYYRNLKLREQLGLPIDRRGPNERHD